ncbi:FG-GAP-like repeat-containing protein [Massilia soli]|uniref:FG-GAP-like repeat-containing protein n=1 Tax=Massilia soli TaxID=2792854 RepID=A0ABS7SN05_9BURK|nr:FG-GAP-like repeat-containing protein [Massilia soli]MBZ2206688.1 FG-GAP-like repeat-containing protein [Massilia soli]
MDYRGTANDDIIDQKALGIADHSNIWGGAGNDTITASTGNLIGEAGNDTLTGIGMSVGAAYWTSPAGIKVNLATGIAHDGYGTVDRLVGIRHIQDSNFNDEIIGSAAPEEFWLNRGNDTVIGGGGGDKVVLYGVKSSEVTITYDKASDTFTLKKHTANGDNGTSTAKGVAAISFTGPNSDEVTVSRDMYNDSTGFLRSPTSLKAGEMKFVQQLRAGDFNGDGKLDILVVRSNTDDMGVTASPLQILAGDGNGNFTDQSAKIFGAIPNINYVPRIFAADFNKDGITDIFAPDFGVDAPPFPGGQNSLYLSSRTTGTINVATANLPQALRQNHGTSVGDVNKDGHLDLFVNALNESSGNANQLLINDGTGKFVVSQQLLPASLTQAGYNPGNTWSMLRDLNNDGYDDIVLGTWDASASPSQVLLNDGRGSFASSALINLPRSGIAKEIVIGIETINLNGDALPDLVLSVTNGGSHGDFYTTPYLQLLVNDGNGQFHDETQARMPQSTATRPPGNANWFLSTTAIDVNGDGHQDIVADGTASETSKVFLNDGLGKFTMSWESSTGAHIVAADVNGDGKPDLIEASSSGFSVLNNVGPSTIPASGVYRASDRGDKVNGGAAAETIYSGKGNDTVNAGAGLDTVIFSGNRAGYTVAKTSSGFTVSGPDGVDTLANVERLKFADASVALDISGSGGQTFRLYQAAFDRAPDTGGLGYWMKQMDGGASLAGVAAGFVNSKEFADLYGGNNPTAELFVEKLYTNVLHRKPDAGGYEYWVKVVKDGAPKADVLAAISESQENIDALATLIGNGFVYVPYAG